MSIIVSNLSFSYDQRPVLDNISFNAQDNQVLSVLGPNGVGKSTLFRCILGLLTGYHGTITVNGVDVRHVGLRSLSRLIAYIPQSNAPSFNFSVFDMVLMGTTAQVSSVSTPGKKQMALVETALDRMGITHLRERGYHHISGGERQLTLLARALVQGATVLILDEPTANLDFGNQIRVLTQVKALAGEGYTIIQSTHNPEQTYLFSDSVMAMKDGRVLAHGSPREVVRADLMRALYGVDIEVLSLCRDTVRVCLPKGVIPPDHDRDAVWDSNGDEDRLVSVRERSQGRADTYVPTKNS